MMPDPPFAGRDEHAIQNRFAAIGPAARPAHRGGIFGQHRRLRASGENFLVDIERFRRERRFVAVFARLGGIARPNVDSLRLPLAKDLPNFFRHLGRIVALHFSERKRMRPREDGIQIQVFGKRDILGQFEGQKARPRIGEAKIRPPPRNFPLHRPLRLRFDKSER